MSRFLLRQSPALSFVVSLGLLFAITWLDLATGHQVSLFLFYIAPIIFAVWSCDNNAAFVIAGLAGVLWSWADLAMGHAYQNETVRAWEIAVRFAFFLVVALAGIAMRERHRASRARIGLLERTQRLEKQIIEVSEYEQQRIGRDLHDGLCQFLAAIGCAVTSLRTELTQRGLNELASKADEVERLLSDSVDQARDLSHGLLPVQFEENGLSAALQELAATTSRPPTLKCNFESAGINGLGNNSYASHLYRIAQEAIHNATRHGQAREIDIHLSSNSNATSLSVADDGTGFPADGEQSNGFGISIMRYRANLMKGELLIESAPGSGTVISCTVPTRDIP